MAIGSCRKRGRPYGNAEKQTNRLKLRYINAQVQARTHKRARDIRECLCVCERERESERERENERGGNGEALRGVDAKMM